MAVVAFTTRANLVAGQPENIADVTNCLDKLLVGVNAIESANIVDATVTDTDLASPNNAVWRTYRSQPIHLLGGKAPGTYYFDGVGSVFASGASASGSTMSLFYIPTLTDYTVAGKTAQGRVLVHAVTNTVASGVALGFGLFPISAVAGGASAIALTLGAVVASSTASLTPVAGTGQQAVSSTFALPTGIYMLGVNWATTTTVANSLCTGIVDLQVSFT